MYNPFDRTRPDVSLCMLSWNRKHSLSLCLKALFESLDATLSHEILIYDNGSTDGSVEVLKQYEGRPGTTIFFGEKNIGLNAYKKLFNRAKGRVIVDLDDDVIEFPKNFDRILSDYLDAYRDYCFIALNVVQDEKTAGAKPHASCYVDDQRGDKVVERGPAGGWCAAFRGIDYLKIAPVYSFLRLSHARVEDGALIGCFLKFLRYRYHGLVKNAKCLHATGPYYAKLFGQTEREREKYRTSGLVDLAASFETASGS